MADDRAARIEKMLAALCAHLGVPGYGRAAGARPAAAGGSSAGAVAPDHDLDSEYGDPEIRRDPKRWTGDSFVGHRYSQTPPEYLDTLASQLDWQADRDEESDARDNKGRPKAQYARRDAARARGWAARLRAGFVAAPPPPREAEPEIAPDDIPF